MSVPRTMTGQYAVVLGVQSISDLNDLVCDVEAEAAAAATARAAALEALVRRAASFIADPTGGWAGKPQQDWQRRKRALLDAGGAEDVT